MDEPTIMFHGAAELPYAVDEVDGAEHLVVAFPKLRPGGAMPPVSLRRRFRLLRAHRLFLGTDRHTYVGPRRALAGAQAATEVMRQEAERLHVPMENVIVTGTSMGAVCALLFGLPAEAGQVFAGAPPVTIGTQLRRLSNLDGPTRLAKSGAGEILAEAEADEGDTTAPDFLDRWIYETVERVTHPATVHLLVSRKDKVYRSTVALAEALAEHPTIECALVERKYRSHNGIKDVFLPYLLESLPDLTLSPETTSSA